MLSGLLGLSIWFVGLMGLHYVIIGYMFGGHTIHFWIEYMQLLNNLK
jgi:hypothetical protein